MNTHENLEKLRTEQGRIATQMRDLVNEACGSEDDAKDARGFTGEDDEKWRKMEARHDELKTLIERAERAISVDEELEKVIIDHNVRHNPQFNDVEPTPPAQESAEQREIREFYEQKKTARRGYDVGSKAALAGDKEYVDAFRSYLRNGESAEQRSILTRAQTVTTTAGGYTIPQGFNDAIEVSMLAFSGIRNVATIWSTPAGNTIDWPTVNDTSNTGELLTINSSNNAQDVAFGQIQFGAYKYSSKHVLVPVELAQDTGINLEALLARLLGERLGRITATAYSNGTGSSQPQGLVYAANTGVTAASATAITMAEVINLIHSVDPAYRMGPNVGFVFSDATLKYLKGLRDESNSNRPLWAPNIASAVPATIDGFPYQIDQAVPSISDLSPDGGEDVMVFGDLSKFVIRDVMGMTLSVLRELYAGAHQVGYNAILRTDSKIIDAGTDPVKVLTMGT